MHKDIEKTHNYVIRGYRFDGQFQTGEIASWVQKKHIAVKPTPLYHHYAAGVEERVHRTLREKASPMMQEVKIAGHLRDIIVGNTQELLRGTTMPEKLWPLAMTYATWLKNRAPIKALRDKITLTKISIGSSIESYDDRQPVPDAADDTSSGGDVVEDPVPDAANGTPSGGDVVEDPISLDNDDPVIPEEYPPVQIIDDNFANPNHPW
ncbi:hypothetical protein FJTKL_05392 [Diaporthe vaccinii]|uniref:Integrase catalytic domain-containing protein n=1 Tax=Diaporthe vaccinii TaxID=105482 RepID=A0ABR4FFN5_9PEZI